MEREIKQDSGVTTASPPADGAGVGENLPRFTPGPWVPSRFGFQVLTGDSWSTVCTLKGDACWEDGRGDYQQEFEWQRQEANDSIREANMALGVFKIQVLSFATIMRRISRATGISAIDIFSPRRNRDIVFARQAVIYCVGDPDYNAQGQPPPSRHTFEPVRASRALVL